MRLDGVEVEFLRYLRRLHLVSHILLVREDQHHSSLREDVK
jgi:hypothetical protein